MVTCFAPSRRLLRRETRAADDTLLYTQNLPRVGLQYFRPDFLPDVELGEIRQPAVRRDHRPVRAEQHLVLQDRVDVAHENRRKVFWRPAGEVDIDVRLVGRDRQRLLLPGEGGVGEDDLQVGKIGSDV